MKSIGPRIDPWVALLRYLACQILFLQNQHIVLYLLNNYQIISMMYFLYLNIQVYFLRCYDQ